MKQFLFIFLLTIQLLSSSETKHKMLPYNQIQAYMSSVDSDAIIMGKGAKTVYVFLDPLCKFSRKFMKTVTRNPYMLEKYNYHIFLYEIPRLRSSNIIHYVYQSKIPLKGLKQIMLKNKQPSTSDTFKSETKKIVRSIKELATKMDVNKRPYIIVSELPDSEQ